MRALSALMNDNGLTPQPRTAHVLRVERSDRGIHEGFLSRLAAR
jgi:hypothetical protein